MGNGYQADPEDLKRVAKGELDTIVTDHIEPAKKAVSSTASHDAQAFRGGPEVSHAETKFGVARDMLADVLENNAENLELAKTALIEIADRYIEAENAAASAVRSAGADAL